MPSSYEFRLLDDMGMTMAILPKAAYFSYSRTIRGMGTFQIGFPLSEFADVIYPVFQPDRRIDIWRSPELGYPTRREQTFLMRTLKIYTRKTDGVQMVTLYGQDPKDLLRRRYAIQPAGYSQTSKTDTIDNMMKAIVREQFLYGSVMDENGEQDNRRAFPQGEFMVEGDVSLGPNFTFTFPDRNVLDILKELHEASQHLNQLNPLTDNVIYFDILTYNPQGLIRYILDEETEEPILDEDGLPIRDEDSPNTGSQQGFIFMTFAGLRGKDRTGEALVFSVENGNLEEPYYTLNRSNEENSIIVKGYGRGDSRQVAIVNDTVAIGASRWNLCEGFEDASTEPEQTNLDNYAYPKLYAESAQEEISAVFLNTPGSDDAPRSLYGIDWDLGDLLPVFYAGKQFNVEVEIVYVAIDEKGQETITGRNSVNNSSEGIA